MRKLIIVEPDAGGHRMQYVRRIAREALKQGIQTQLLTLPASLEHPAYKLMQEELGGQIEPVLLRPTELTAKILETRNLFAMQLANFKMFASHFKKLKSEERPDRVFVPYLDYCDKAIALLGSPFGATPWAGLGMQYKFHYAEMGALRPAERGDKLKERLFAKLLRNTTLNTFFTIDELLLDFTKQRYPKLADKTRYVGDPVDMEGDCTREEARAMFGIPVKDKVILVYGALSLRKGIDSLLAATQESTFPKGVSLLLAGSQDAEVQRLLNGQAAVVLRSQNRLYERNLFLDDGEEYAAFKAADAVWLGYKDFYGMSGVMVQAGKMQLPIIGCNEGLIGRMTDKYKLGHTVNVKDIHEVTNGINSIINHEAEIAEFRVNGLNLSIRHTSAEFASKIICQSL